MPNKESLISIIAQACEKYSEDHDKSVKREAEIILEAVETAGYKVYHCGTNIEEQLVQIYGVPIDKMREKTRDRAIVEPRQVGMFFNYLNKHNTKLTLVGIANIYGKDHATVIHAVKKISNLLSQKWEVGIRENVERMSQLTGIDYSEWVGKLHFDRTRWGKEKA